MFATDNFFFALKMALEVPALLSSKRRNHMQEQSIANAPFNPSQIDRFFHASGWTFETPEHLTGPKGFAMQRFL